MRAFSFLQESTRYCNYSKGKFNNELTYIIPSWINLNYENVSILSVGNNEVIIDGEEHQLYDENNEALKIFLYSLVASEEYYFSLLDKGWKPQQVRQILPNALKTELYMCGFASDWEHFFKLRDAGSAHPDAQALAMPLHKEFIKRNYIENANN